MGVVNGGMTPRRILQTAVPAVAVIALLGACGADTARDTAKKAAVIRVGAQSGAANEAAVSGAASVNSDAKMMPIQRLKFVAGEGLTEPTGPMRAWTFPMAGAEITDAQKALLAKTFGLSGSWTTLPKDQGGASVLGDINNGDPGLSVQPDALGSWWFSPGWKGQTGVAVSCAETGTVAVEPASGSGSSSGSEGSDGASTPPDTATVVTVAVDPAPERCATPEPP